MSTGRDLALLWLLWVLSVSVAAVYLGQAVTKPFLVMLQIRAGFSCDFTNPAASQGIVIGWTA